MHPHGVRAALLAAVVLGLGLSACGEETKTASKPTKALTECREQWSDVAETVAGLDEDEHPSALAERWGNVVATVAYYETTETAADCQETIEAQVDAITVLREFSTRVQPFDMEYQADLVAPDVGRYLADPLPEPVTDKKGKKVIPPSQAAVRAALEALEAAAPTANEYLEPAWGQLGSVELTDEDAVTTAIQALADLAAESPDFAACKAALEVIATAIAVSKGVAPGDLPSTADEPSTSATPGSTPSATPAG